MTNDEVFECAKVVMDNCAKTTNCFNCPLFKRLDDKRAGFCMIEGLMPWEWELNEYSAQAEKEEGND